MKERILDAIFDGWCDGECGQRQAELPEVQKTINDFCERFHATRTDELFIERTLMNLICTYEKNAFTEGFSICLDLLTGKIFY